jgi:hypothetical protein
MSLNLIKNYKNKAQRSMEAKGLMQGLSARRTKDLLKLNRDQLR